MLFKNKFRNTIGFIAVFILIVLAVLPSGYSYVTKTLPPQPPDKWAINLVPGWNFVSAPFATLINSDTSDCTAKGMQVGIVQHITYEAGKKKIVKTATPDLALMLPGIGYLVYLEPSSDDENAPQSSCVVKLSGKIDPASTLEKSYVMVSKLGEKSNGQLKTDEWTLISGTTLPTLLNPKEPTTQSTANRGDCNIGQILELEYDAAAGKTKRTKVDTIRPDKSYLIYIDPPETGAAEYCILSQAS